MSELDRQFKQLFAKIEDSIKEVVIDTGESVMWSVTKRIRDKEAMSAIGSPVDTGLYSENHNIAVGAPDPSIASKNMDEQDVRPAVKNMKLGQSLYISNNLSYAERLQELPSPLEKTSGDMYQNAADYTVASMVNYGKRNACKNVAMKFSPAKTHKIEVKL